MHFLERKRNFGMGGGDLTIMELDIVSSEMRRTSYSTSLMYVERRYIALHFGRNTTF